MRGGQVFVLNINTSLSRTHFAVFCVSFYPPPALMLFATLCVCSPGSDSFHLYCHILENFLLSPFFSISNQFCYLRSDSFNYSSRERILCFTSLHIFTPPKKGNFYPITPFSTSSIWYVILIYYWYAITSFEFSSISFIFPRNAHLPQTLDWTPRLAVFMFNLKTKSDTTFQQLWAVSFPPWNATVFLPTVLRRWCTFFVLFQNLSSPQHMSRVTCRCVTVTLYQILPPSDFSPFAGITNPLNHSKNFFEFLHSSPTPPPFYLKSRSVFLR